jgi:hypothetical protein
VRRAPVWGFPYAPATMAPDDVDGRVDELYCLPLERFVPERDALARELRGSGKRAEATQVAKLPKPALAAWAVNQVVRSQGAAARALWAAGDEVLGVQERAVAGEAAGAELRDAIVAQRAALSPLADAARGMLTARGSFLGEQAVQAVIETLHAAAVDPGARPDVERGRLAKPLRLAGLGAMTAVAAPRGAPAAAKEAPPEEPPAAEGPPPDREAERRAAAEDREAERAALEEERRAEAERARVAKARAKALERAVRARDAALQRVERRRAELADAEEELERLEEDVRAAEEALEE